MIVIHTDNPQIRLIRQVVEKIRAGGVIAYPTDSSYALGCAMGERKAIDIISRIRQVDKNHNYTLVMRDLGELATYAKVPNAAFRIIKSFTPGPYTFILDATREVPRRLMNPKKKTIGVRIPDNKIALALVAELGQPLMTATLQLPGEEYPMTDPYEIEAVLGHQITEVIDGGYCGLEATSVIDMSGDTPVVIREGKGEVSLFV